MEEAEINGQIAVLVVAVVCDFAFRRQRDDRALRRAAR